MTDGGGCDRLLLVWNVRSKDTEGHGVVNFSWTQDGGVQHLILLLCWQWATFEEVEWFSFDVGDGFEDCCSTLY